jgi:hypothetical protein
VRFIRALLCIFALGLSQHVDARLFRASSAGPVQMSGGVVGGIGGPTYYTNMRPFVNWAQQGGTGNGNRYLNSNAITTLQAVQTGYFNSNLDLNSGSAISGVTNLSISLFTPPPATGTYAPGPQSATFQATVNGSGVMTVASISGTIKAGDQVSAPGLQGSIYNIQPFGTSGTSGTGGNGTYQLTGSPPIISSAVAGFTNTYWWTGLQMTIAWTGSSVTSVNLSGTIGTGGSFPTCTSSPCTFTYGYNPLNTALIFNFPSGAASPPTKIQVYETQFATQMADCAAGTNLYHCWAPDWVAQNGPIGIKRYMDVLQVLGSGVTDPVAQGADQNYGIIGSGCGGYLAGNGSISGTTLTMITQSADVEPGMLLTDSAGLIAANTHTTSGTGGSNSTYTIDTSQSIPSVTASFTANGTTTITVTGTPSATIYPNMVIGDGNVLISNNGQPNGTSIVQQLSGTTGGAGTYQLSRAAQGSGSGTATISDVFYGSAPTSGWSGNGGPKCGIHPSLVAALANATNTGIHWNFPPFVTNTGATNVYNYFNSNLKNGLTVSYELCNEIWNFSLGCFSIMNFSGVPTVQNGSNGAQAAGYRMANLMYIANSVYGPSNRANWRGEVGVQPVGNTSAGSSFLSGAQAWITANAPSLNISSLFNDVIVSNYLSDFNTSANVTAVTTGATTSVTLSGAPTPGIANGQKRRIFFSVGSGLSAYNNMDVTLANVSGNTFQFSDFTTTGTFTNSGTNWLAPPGYFDMTDASTACYTGAGATISSGSITGTTFTAGGTVTGTILPGQTLTGVAGIPANDYIISGSGTSWVLAQGVSGTVTGSMSTTPCTTNYQFYAYEFAKSLLTGTNDYGYTLGASATSLPSVDQTQQLLAASYGLTLRNYEGGWQVEPSFANGTVVGDFNTNFYYDSSDLDPTYSPATTLAAVYNNMNAVWSDWPGQYTISGGLGTFNVWPYPAAENGAWQQIQYENLHPFVDPTAPTSASCSNIYAGGLSSGSGSTTLSTTINIGATSSPLVAVYVGQNGGTFGPPTVTIGGVSLTEGPSFNNSGVQGGMWTGIATGLSGNQTLTVTFNAGSTFRPRPVFAFTTANLNSQSILSSASGAGSATLNYTKNGCIIGASTLSTSITPWGGTSGANTLNSSTPGQAPNPTTYSAITSADGGSGAVLTAPFNSSIFSVVSSATPGDAAAFIEVR